MRVFLLCVCVIAGGAIGSAFANLALGAEPRKGALTNEQLEQQAALLAEFRKAKLSPEKRFDIIDRATELSPITLNKVLEILGKELNKPLSDYRQQFMKAAAHVAGQRTNAANLQVIGELRVRVLALSKQENLTKEMIVEVGDPGLKRLQELIVVGRDEVVIKHPELLKRREALQSLGKQWEKCVARLLEESADDDAKDKTPDDEAQPARDKPKPKPKTGAKGAAADAPQDAADAQPPSFEQYLVKEEEIAAALAMPMDDATRAVLAANSQLAAKIDPEEARCVLDLNLTRNLLGLTPVQLDLLLTAAARDHSSDMETLKFFSHDSPVPGKATLYDRAKRAGTMASAENIAAGTVDGAAANQMWWHSPGHHKNMLGNHTRVGLGRSGKYWTELFGR